MSVIQVSKSQGFWHGCNYLDEGGAIALSSLPVFHNLLLLSSRRDIPPERLYKIVQVAQKGGIASCPVASVVYSFRLVSTRIRDENRYICTQRNAAHRISSRVAFKRSRSPEQEKQRSRGREAAIFDRSLLSADNCSTLTLLLAMLLQRMTLTALLTLVATLTISDYPFIQHPNSQIQNSSVLAQTPDTRKAEAERLLQQGFEQYQAGQFKAAIPSWQQALTLYREIHFYQGEVQALRNLGGAYSALKDYPKAIEYHQQALVIDRELHDRHGEGYDLGNLGEAYYSLNDYAKAIDYEQQHLAIAKGIKDRQEEGKALNNLGVAYSSLKDDAKAIEYHKQALAIAREIKDRSIETVALEKLAFAYESLGDWTHKLEYQQQRLVIARENRDRLLEGRVLLGIAQAYEQLENYTKAIDYYQQSLVIGQEIKDRNWESVVLGNIGNIYYLNLKDYPNAIEYLQQSLVIAREVKNREMEKAAVTQLGNAYFGLGDRTRTIEFQEQALGVAREFKDRKWEQMILGSLGEIYTYHANYPKATDYMQQSLMLARELKDRKAEGHALTGLGAIYLSLGNYPKAIEYHEQALTIAREFKDLLGEVSALNNLGGVYLLLGNYPKTIEYQEQSLVIARELKDHQIEAGALVNLASAYLKLSQYPQAIEYMQQNLAIAQENHDTRGEMAALNNLGNVHLYLGDFPKAIEYHQQCLALAQKLLDRKLESQTLGTLGLSYLILKDYTQGLDYLEQGLAIAKDIKDRHTEGELLRYLGLGYLSLDDYTKATEYQEQSLAITREVKERDSEGGSLATLGMTYFLLGNSTKAMEYLHQSLAIAKETQDRKLEGGSLFFLGHILFKQGNLTAATETLRTAINIEESLRPGLDDTHKVSIFETQAEVYKLLQQVLIAQNQIDAALEISERGRARAFVELLAGRLSSAPIQTTSITPPTLSQIKQIASAENSTLVQYSIVKDDFKIDGKLQTKELELYIWVIKPTGEVIFRRSDLKPLWQKQNTTIEDLVTSSRESIGVRGLPIIGVVPRPGTQQGQEISQTKRLQQLHQLLIEPIADLLPKDPNARITFIPQSYLFLVPFPALQDASGKYLIEQHTILTAPSIQVLQLTHQQQQSKGSRESGVGSRESLVVGNPTMPKVPPKIGEPPQQLPSLPGAEQEAKAIAPLLNTQAITGDKATKALMMQLMPSSRIIHLATHGILDDVRGIGSAIALAPSGNDDGLLTAEEILNLKLNAQLVVLSACNTGRGRITGDGVIGLSRALISAGVPSVLVSLWSVPDAPTASLMTEFYQNFQKTPDKAQALRQAMLTTKKQHPNPRDWAAFTLIGEAE